MAGVCGDPLCDNVVPEKSAGENGGNILQSQGATIQLVLSGTEEPLRLSRVVCF
jgi:hypothetical protein